jgi:hypothetical protein
LARLQVKVPFGKTTGYVALWQDYGLRCNLTGLHVKLQFGNTYRIMTLMKVETIIIGSFVASPITPNVMLVIMNVEAFKTVEFMFFGNVAMRDIDNKYI